jgi:hypothetical protein
MNAVSKINNFFLFFLNILNKKNKLLEFFKKYKFEILLGIFAFILIYYYKKPFIIEGAGPLDWDGYSYLRNIYDHKIAPLMIGRMGFVYFFAIIWDIFKIFNFSILNFHHVVRFMNIVFASLTIVFFYLMIKRIFNNKLIGLGSSLLLLFSKDFINYSGRVYAEAMMIFFIVLSFFFFTKSFESSKVWQLYLAAFLFGFAFEVRESALFSILFFLVFFIFKKSKSFTIKNYFIFCVIMFVTAVTGPLVVYLIKGQDYINQILYWINFRKDISYPLIYRLVRVYNNIIDGFGMLILPLIGTIIMFIKRKYKELLIAVSLALPIITFTFYGHMAERFFIVGYLGLSLLASAAIFYLIDYFSFLKNKRIFVYLLILFILLGSNFFNFHNELIREQKYAKQVEQYGLHLLNDFPENSLLIVGARSNLMKYYTHLTNSKKEIIGPDKKSVENINQTFREKLSINKTIIFDPSQFYFLGARENIIELISFYDYEKNSDGFYIIENE